MATMTATEAKNRFGEMLDTARKEPVFIEKNGRPVGVLVSVETYAALAENRGAPRVNPAVARLHKESLARSRWRS